MMEWIQQNTTTLIALGIIVLGVVGYFLFFKGPGISSDVTFESVSPVSNAEQSFVALFEELQQVQFDRTFFEDPFFRALINTGQPIIEEPVGRPNPFAPL